VNLDRDGNLMEAMESWVQTAEPSNTSRRMGDADRRLTDQVRDMGDKAETSANDITYRGLKWVVTVAGVVPEMTEIVYRLENTTVDLFSREGVEKAWTDMSLLLYRNLPPHLNNPRLQSARWKVKMTDG
jgi:hypothetical protein